MRRALLVIVLLLLPVSVYAQNGFVTGTALDNNGNTVAGATVTVCPLGSLGIPCSPVTASTTSNGQGSFSVGVPLGTYTVTVFRTGIISTSSTIVVAPSNITVANNVTYSGAVVFSGSLTVSGTGTFTGLLSCKNFENVPCVDAANTQGWTGTNYGAWWNAAIASLPTSASHPVGTIYLFGSATGATIPISTTVAIDPFLMHTVGAGSGTVHFVCSVSPCITMAVGGSWLAGGQEGSISGFTLDGNSVASVIGIQAGGLNRTKFSDIHFTLFNGASAIPWLWSNASNTFSEQIVLDHVHVEQSNICIKFQDLNANTGNSADYDFWTVYELKCNIPGSATGIDIENDAHVNAGQWRQMNNANGNGITVMLLNGTSQFSGHQLEMFADDSGNTGASTFWNVAAGAQASQNFGIVEKFYNPTRWTNTITGTYSFNGRDDITRAGGQGTGINGPLNENGTLYLGTLNPNGVSGAVGFQNNTGQTVAGITGTFWGCVNPTVAWLCEMDLSGNLGIAGGINTLGISSFPGSTVALTADWTCGTGGTVASCVAATIIGSGGGVPLTFTLPSITRSYTLECDGVVGQATAATANQWNLLTATNGATNTTANYSMATAATTSAFGAVTDQASTTTTFQIAPSWTLGGTATKMPFHIWAKVEGASASGTVLSLQLVAPTVADLVTIYRGSACRIF